MTAASHRVKSVDMHPTEPLMLCALFNGDVVLVNYATKTKLSVFAISPEVPVRCVKFIVSLNSFCCGGDDMNVHIVNMETSKKVKLLAHEDYIRSIAVHEPQRRLLTSSDDLTVKLWNWGRGWRHVTTFKGHEHYVMRAVFNRKDSTEFVTASLDRTVKVWSTTSPSPIFTLPHDHGVSCVDFCHKEEGDSMLFLVSATDGGNVCVWDYASKVCLHVFSSIHTHHVTCVTAHPTRPLMFSTGEDGVVGVYSTQTWRHETTLNYGPQRGWAVAVCPNRNVLSVGLDEGLVVLKLGLTDEMLRIAPQTEKVIDCDDTSFPAAAEDAHLLHDPSGEYVAVITDTEYDETTWGQPPPCCTQRGRVCWCLVLLLALFIVLLVLLLRKK